MLRPAASGLVVALVLGGVSACSFFNEDCDGMGEYKNLGGQTVSLLAPDKQVDQLKSALRLFTKCTKAEVAVRTLSRDNKTFEKEVETIRKGGKPPPDVALIDHRQLKALASTNGRLQAAPKSVITALQENYADTWKQVMSVNGSVYGVPVDTEMKSLVWYSPTMLKKKGLAPPQSWEDLTALTSRIAASKPPAGTKPWCAGFAAEENSGWPGTDWIEDVLLRLSGTDVYDEWVDHKIPFNDAPVVEATNQVSSILRNDAYTNGGLGSPAGIAETPIFDAGLPILSGECYLHRQGASYPWPAKTPTGSDLSIAPNGDVWAFSLPPKAGGDGHPILGGGEMAALFSLEPKARALQTFFATTGFANARASAPGSKGWVTANQNADLDRLPTALDKQVSQWLQQENAQFRYDGSDEMPDPIAGDKFWKAIMVWIKGNQTSAAMLKSVQTAWETSG